MQQKETRKKANPGLRVLVMGGLGFIGSHLCRSLLSEGYDVRIFDKLYGSRELIRDFEPEVEIAEGDVERHEDVLGALQDMDVCVDLIHTTVPGSSMQDPVYDIESNVVSSVKWLSSLGKTGLSRVIYVSSGGTVYGVPRSNPIREDHPTDPISSYGISKLAIEKYVSMYADLCGIQYRICRPSNVFGEDQQLNIGQGVIGVFLKRALAGQPIEIWGDGACKRDYLYVKDLVSGIVKLIRHEGNGRVFNVSTGTGYSLNDIVAIVSKCLGSPVKVDFRPLRGYDVPVNVLDSSLLRTETGWSPETDLVAGIRRVYAWLKTRSKPDE